MERIRNFMSPSTSQTNIREHNRKAWDKLVENQDRWTQPVSSDEIERAKTGDWNVILTPSTVVPRNWFPSSLKGVKLLCLAGGGGQQAPLFAAAGAEVTVFDNSAKQLAQDRFVAQRDSLSIQTVEGDMRDLSRFPNESFDFIFHPCSNCFVDDILVVWKEAFRVLKRGGILISGFSNPVPFQFDPEKQKPDQTVFELKYTAPYSDLNSLTETERETLYPGEPLHFAHSLTDQIGGQLAAGFHLVGFFEDDWGGQQPIDRFMKSFIATRALKP